MLAYYRKSQRALPGRFQSAMSLPDMSPRGARQRLSVNRGARWPAIARGAAIVLVWVIREICHNRCHVTPLGAPQDLRYVRVCLLLFLTV